MANEPLPAMARGRPGQAAGSALRERQHHRRSGRLGLLTGLLTVLSLVVLSPGGSQRAAQAQGRAEVAIIDGAFLPASILVQAGDTVIWANIGTVTHTVTADDGSFASGPLAPGARFRQTFPAAGLVTYYCALHPQMLGAITVTAAPAPGGGSTATRLPGTGVGTTAPSALLPMALLALLVATGLSTQATLVRCRTRKRTGVNDQPCRCGTPSMPREVITVVLLALAPLLLFALSVRAAQATPGPEASAIPPVVWQLVGFTEANGPPVAIDDPTRYTVQFLPEGLLLARFDCNQGRGGYTAAEGVLTLTPMAVTAAMCPPDSYDLAFQRLLGQATAYRFNPEIGHLVLRGEAGVLDLQPALTGVVWQWQETLSNTGEVTLRPEHPEHYTVEFLPDGTLAIQADCNHAMGAYIVTGAQLDLQVGGATRMACPPGSLMDPFLAELDRVVSYTMQQALSLALSGGGVMQFTAVVSAPATPSAG